MVLRKSFYIRWSAGRSPQVHEVNPGRDPSEPMLDKCKTYLFFEFISHAIYRILYQYSCKTHNISSKIGFVGF